MVPNSDEKKAAKDMLLNVNRSEVMNFVGAVISNHLQTSYHLTSDEIRVIIRSEFEALMAKQTGLVDPHGRIIG